MWPDDEKAVGNTLRIVKDFEEVWAHFCPPKPCLPLSTDTRKYAGKPAYFLYYSAFFAMHSCRVCMMVYALSQST